MTPPAPKPSQAWAEAVAALNSGPDVERTSFFSDAVFAVAMTLLAVELGVPDGPEDHLLASLAEITPEVLAYFLSFAVVAAYWLTHHRYFRLLVKFTVGLQRLNLGLLSLIALVPFTTSLLGRFGDDPVAAIVYAGVIAGVGGMQVWLWEFARTRRLFDPGVPTAVVGYLRGRSLVVPVVFLLSIPVTLAVGPTAGELSWALVIPGDLFVRWWVRRRPPEGALPGRLGAAAAGPAGGAGTIPG